MFVTIILTLNLFYKYREFLQKDLNVTTTLPGVGDKNREEAKKIKKN